MTQPPYDTKGAAPAFGGPALNGPAKPSGGTWYFVLTVLSAGLLAAVPFWHAWSRLRHPRLRTLALAYTAVDVFLFVLVALTPSPDSHPAGNDAVSTIGGFAVIAVVIAACVQLRAVRRAVYAGPRARPMEADPVVTRVLAARHRREEARKMWAADPALAHELGVGRPDLRRGFDDGGLVDLNGAPAEVIAGVCGIAREQAEAIVTARLARGGTYYNLGELFVDVALPADIQGVLTEHALV